MGLLVRVGVTRLTIRIYNLFKILTLKLIKAFDQDLGSKDDLIGEATLDISKLELTK